MDNTAQNIAEFRIMRNVAHEGKNPFTQQEDRILMAYRNQVKKVNNNFPIKI